MNVLDRFIEDGCRVRIQKGFPFIDNIIQVFLSEKITGKKPLINQIDFYIYRKKDDYAYMRWFNSPSGLFAKQLKNNFFRLKLTLLSIEKTNGIIKFINFIFPKFFRCFVFKLFFNLYYKFGKCIFHVIPIKYFQELKTINCYDIPFKISSDTDNYLAYRYGENWKIPDSGFNTDFYKQKWKKINARQELRFSLLKKPQIEFNLQEKYIEFLPDNLNGVP